MEPAAVARSVALLAVRVLGPPRMKIDMVRALRNALGVPARQLAEAEAAETR